MGEEWSPLSTFGSSSSGSPFSSLPLMLQRSLRLALPRDYDGAAAGCQVFLLQLELYLATVRPTPSGEEMVSLLVFCLTGRAL